MWHLCYFRKVFYKFRTKNTSHKRLGIKEKSFKTRGDFANNVIRLQELADFINFGCGHCFEL